MKKKVIETIESYKMLNNGDKLVLGVSGGVDSMAMLYVLLEIKKEYNLDIFVAHINHGVRGEEAREDQEFVRKISEKLELPFFTTNVNMNQYARDKKISAEEAGRILRYGFFRKVKKKVSANKIAVAHNLNDQAETLLMRFLRGTGIDGLRGIEHYKKDIIRPLLDISRDDLEGYIKDKKIKIREDKTNSMPIYTRNKIRLELIPYIVENFNPNIIGTLNRSSKLARIDSEFLESYTETRYNSMVKKINDFRIKLDKNKFVLENLAIQQRIVRKSIYELLDNLQGISNINIESIVNLFLSNETGKEVHITGDLRARVSYDNLIIERIRTDIESKYNYLLKPRGKTYIDDLFLELDISYLDISEVTNKPSKYTKYLDANKISGKLRLRNRENGDRFTPLGMKGSKKIKDFFIDEKIDKSERDRIPLLVDDKNIIWVVGYRINEDYKITKETKKIIKVRIKTT